MWLARASTFDINLFISLVTWLECDDKRPKSISYRRQRHTARIYTRAHTHTHTRTSGSKCTATIFYALGERDSTATRHDDCPYRRAGEYCVALWRWAIAPATGGPRAPREKCRRRRAACHALDETLRCKL